MTRGTPTCVLLGALIVGLSGCDSSVAVVSFSGATMGTVYDVVVELGGTDEDTTGLGALIEDELAHLERVMSTYDPASDVSRFSDHDGTDPRPVDRALLEVLAAALDVSGLSGGAFDPTVAPLVDAWGFGPVEGTPPDSARVAALTAAVGYEALVLAPSEGTLAKKDPRVRIDLSGVGKGFAAERVSARLRERGYRSALVDVGGELRVLGSHGDGRPWRVGLEGPGVSGPAVLGTVDLVDEAVATSGDYRNYYEEGGVLYAHIVDPRTGYPIPYRGFSVSVVHDDAASADAWATALTVLGPEEGFELAESRGLAAVFAWLGPEGVRTRVTAAMADRVTSIDRPGVDEG
jgi:thiamine biosynthesis lipoprotein